LVAVAKAKKGYVQAATPQWRDNVNAELDKEGRGSRARLAEYLGCSQGRLNSILSEDSKFSRYVPQIQTYFEQRGIKIAPPIMSSDLEEIRYVIDEMGDIGRDFFHELKDMPIDQRKQMITAMRGMLAAMRSKPSE